MVPSFNLTTKLPKVGVVKGIVRGLWVVGGEEKGLVGDGGLKRNVGVLKGKEIPSVAGHCH